MTSRRLTEKRYIAPPVETDNATGAETDADLLDGSRRKRRKRDANVYDAVAGS